MGRGLRPRRWPFSARPRAESARWTRAPGRGRARIEGKVSWKGLKQRSFRESMETEVVAAKKEWRGATATKYDFRREQVSNGAAAFWSAPLLRRFVRKR